MLFLLCYVFLLSQVLGAQDENTKLSNDPLDVKNFHQELKKVSHSLRVREPDIANRLDKLAESGSQPSKMFTDTISGLQKTVRDMAKASKPNVVNWKEMFEVGNLLKDHQDDLVHTKRKFVDLEADIHDNIENLKRKKETNEFIAREKEVHAEKFEGKIKVLNKEIVEHESDARGKESDAADYSRMSRSRDNDAGGDAVWGLLFGAAGVIAAPWYGLYSVVPAVGAAIKKFSDAAKNERKAREYRNEASSLRRRAHDLRTEADKLRREKGDMAQKAEELKRTAVDLEKAAEQLEVASGFLQGSLKVTGDAMKLLQNMHSVLQEVKLDGDTAKTILPDHEMSNPDHDPIATKLMSNLQESFQQLEKVINSRNVRQFIEGKDDDG